MLSCFLALISAATEYKLCVAKNNAKCGEYEYKKLDELDSEISSGSSVFFYIPEQVDYVFNIGHYPDSNISFSAPSNSDGSLIHISIHWPTDIDTNVASITFENVSVNFDVIIADNIVSNNAEFHFSSDSSIITTGSFEIQDERAIGAYIECEKAKLEIGENNIKNTIRVVAKELELTGLNDDYEIVQKGNTLTILRNGEVKRSFMLLGYEESRTTKVTIDCKEAIFRSLYSNAECAMQDIVLPNAKNVTFKEGYWYGNEHITLSAADKKIELTNFGGSFTIQDDAAFSGNGDVTITDLIDCSSITVGKNINLILDMNLNDGVDITTGSSSSVYIKEISSKVNVEGEGNVKLPSVFHQGGRLSCPKLTGERAVLYLPSTEPEPSDPIITISGTLSGTFCFDIIGASVTEEMDVPIFSYTIDSNPTVTFYQNEKNSRRILNFDRKNDSKSCALIIEGVYEFPVGLDDIDELNKINKNNNLAKVKYAEIELNESYDYENGVEIPEFVNSPTLLFTTSGEAVDLRIDPKVAKTIGKLIIGENVNLNSSSCTFNEVYFSQTGLMDFRNFESKSIIIDDQEKVYFGKYQKLKFNDVTTDLTIKGASEISFLADTYDPKSIHIDVTKDLTLSGNYNNENITLTFISTESLGNGKNPMLTLSGNLVGSVEFENPVTIYGQGRILNANAGLVGDLNFEMETKSIVISNADSSNINNIESGEIYFMTASIDVNHPMSISSLAFSNDVTLNTSGYLKARKVTFARQSTTFDLNADFHRMPLIRANKYMTSDQEYVISLLGEFTVQEQIYVNLQEMTGYDIFDEVDSIPFACFDKDFDCLIAPSYLIINESADVHLTCDASGRKDELCLRITKGRKTSDEIEYKVKSYDTFSGVVLIVCACIYIAYLLYFCIYYTCVTYCNSYYWCNEEPKCHINCDDCILIDIDSKFGRFCIMCSNDIDCCITCKNCVFCRCYDCYLYCDECVDFTQNCLRCVFSKCCSESKECDECIVKISECFIFDENKSIEESLQDISQLTAEMSIELNKYTSFGTKTLNNARYRSLLYSKLRREISRANRSIVYNFHKEGFKPEWKNFIPDEKEEKEEDANDNEQQNDDSKYLVHIPDRIEDQTDENNDIQPVNDEIDDLLLFKNKDEIATFPFALEANKFQKDFLDKRFQAIREAIDFMNQNKYEVKHLIPLCYNTIKIFNVEKFDGKNHKNANEVVPVDAFNLDILKRQVQEIENSDKFNESDFWKVLKYFKKEEKKGTITIFERRIICQIFLSNKNSSPLLDLSFYLYETSENNWDYGAETEFKRKIICPYTFRPLVADPITGDIEENGYKSQRLNSHQYFIDYIRNMPNDNDTINKFLVSRDNFAFYIYQRVIPAIKPTLPQGILEIVDMTLADYQRIPGIEKITVRMFKRITEKSLHAFYELAKEKLYRSSIVNILGANIYPTFAQMYKRTKDQPEFLDILMLNAFDVIVVNKSLAEVESNYLPTIQFDKEPKDYTDQEIFNALNEDPKDRNKGEIEAFKSNYDYIKVDTDEDIKAFCRLSCFDRKVVALSLLTSNFIPPSKFFDRAMYQNNTENYLNIGKEIENYYKSRSNSSDFAAIYHGVNPLTNYFVIRGTLPSSTDQLIGFYFNHSVPNMKLFVPYTIRDILNHALNGANERNDKNDSTSLEIKGKETSGESYHYFPPIRDALKNTLTDSGLVYIDNTSTLDFNSKKHTCKEVDPNIVEINACDIENIDLVAIDNWLKNEGKELSLSCFNAAKMAFATIDIACINESSSIIMTIPVAGPVNSVLQKQEIKELELDFHNGTELDKPRLDKFREMVENHNSFELKVIALALSDLKNAPIIDCYKAAKKSLDVTADTYPVHDFDICPATLYPFMTDKSTWSELPNQIENEYRGFPVFKYLFEFVLRCDPKKREKMQYPQFLPTVDELLMFIYTETKRKFEKRSISEYVLMPPNAKEICLRVVNSYKKILIDTLHKTIDKTQFLLRTNVCHDRTKRMEFERRYLKKSGVKDSNKDEKEKQVTKYRSCMCYDDKAAENEGDSNVEETRNPFFF